VYLYGTGPYRVVPDICLTSQILGLECLRVFFHLGGLIMSRKLAVVLFAMVVLVGAMGLKTVVTAHGDGSIIMAAGSAPAPPTPYKAGSAPAPPTPYRAGSAPAPPTPY